MQVEYESISYDDDGNYGTIKIFLQFQTTRRFEIRKPVRISQMHPNVIPKSGKD